MLDNKSVEVHSLVETGAMPVARGNVAFDLSALSTSLAKRTGADEYASDPLPSAGGGSLLMHSTTGWSAAQTPAR